MLELGCISDMDALLLGILEMEQASMRMHC